MIITAGGNLKFLGVLRHSSFLIWEDVSRPCATDYLSIWGSISRSLGRERNWLMKGLRRRRSWRWCKWASVTGDDTLEGLAIGSAIVFPRRGLDSYVLGITSHVLRYALTSHSWNLSVLMGRSRGQKTCDYVEHRLKVKRTFRKRRNFRSCLIEYFLEFLSCRIHCQREISERVGNQGWSLCTQYLSE